MKSIFSTKAPKPIGPYSQAFMHAKTLYTSGQIGMDQNGVLAEGLEAQARQALQNLEAVAKEATTSLAHTLKVTVYLTDLANFQVVNTIMETYFQEPYPARTTVGVLALPRGALVEFDAIIALP